MNEFTKEWFGRLIPYLHEGFIDAGEGMLMGMHNGASTTLGLAAAGYRCPDSCNVLVLRSSDDSMTVYSVENAELMGPLIELDRKNLKMLGINLSPDKSFLFDHGFGEYTSWFLDGELVSQYGVETSAMRPQGKNPHDDCNSISKTVHVALLANTINPIGGELWLRVGIDNVRRLYALKRNPNKRQRIKDTCQLLADGGPSPWNIGNCHLEEISIKESKKNTVEEGEYFLRISNPENPFNHENHEDVTYSKEVGELIVSMPDVPRNIFTFMKKTNRTSAHKVNVKRLEGASAEVMRIVQGTDMRTNLRVPNSKSTISEHLIAHFLTMKSSVDLDDTEIEKFNDAIAKLEGRSTSKDEAEVFWSVGEEFEIEDMEDSE